MAIGALRAIHDMNIQVPDDIAFICNGSLHQYDLLHDSAITELVEPIGLMGEECAMMMLEKLNGGKSATAPPAASAMTATWCLRAQRSIPSTVVSPILHQQLDKTRVDLRSICTKVITHARYDGQALQEGPNLKKTGFSPSKMP